MGRQPAGTTGRPAPDFCLPTARGEMACLRDLLSAGPVLLWFFRGHW
jgi:peroxiredoxin